MKPHSENTTVKVILMYSPDVDFCASLTLFFQNNYRIISTTDGSALPMLAALYHPDLIIADALPTDWILIEFDHMKQANPHLRILLFRVLRSDDSKREERTLQSIDAVLYKPLDVELVATVVKKLLSLQSEGKNYETALD